MSLGTVRRLLGRVPGSRPVHRLAARAIHVARSVLSPFLRFAPAGHFYSPLPDAREIPQDPLGGDVAELPGIDLAEAEQLAMLERMAPFHAELPWGEEQRPGLRYAYRNPFFNHNDAVVLFGMMRALRPRRVIEVGSGWSSAAMLDIRDRFPEVATRFTFVEPYPQRLLSLLGADGGGGAEGTDGDVRRACRG